MKFMHDLGLVQLVMPPHLRPHFKTLHKLGFTHIREVPRDLLYAVYSASSMWVANAATISPAPDTKDGKLHITPANLLSKLHRLIETEKTAEYLKIIFPEPHFVHHAPLPSHMTYSDEGAANHMRLCKSHSNAGMEIFVYGGESKKYPARQSLQASQAVARLHTLNPKKTVFLKQKARAIDAGVFHNDVIAISNEDLFIYHESAYEDMDIKPFSKFRMVVIKESELKLSDAVSTYFFNSQLVTLPSGRMTVIAPTECEEHTRARKCFDRLLAEGYLESVHYMNLRESMKNGGGPACLRLRMPLSSSDLTKVNRNFILNDRLYNTLCQWIEKHYRDRITYDDLRDPLLPKESQAAMADLYHILKIKMEVA